MPKLILRVLILSAPLWLNDFYRFFLPPKSNVLSEVLDIIIYVIWQATLIYMAFSAKWFTLESIGLKNIRWVKEIGVGLLWVIPVTFIYLALSIGNDFVLEIIGKKVPPSGHPASPDWHPALIQLHLLYICFTAGFFEEMIYRGIIPNQLELKISNRIALVLISSTMFMLIHWSLSYTIWMLSFTLGVFWSILFFKTRRMVPLIVSHAVFDYFSFSGLLTDLLLKINVNAI